MADLYSIRYVRLSVSLSTFHLQTWVSDPDMTAQGVTSDKAPYKNFQDQTPRPASLAHLINHQW